MTNKTSSALAGKLLHVHIVVRKILDSPLQVLLLKVYSQYNAVYKKTFRGESLVTLLNPALS